MIPTLSHYLAVAALLFALGLFTVLTRRNAVAVLMGVELMLNGANINLVAFNKFIVGGLTGQTFALFVVVLAAAEAAVGLAIVIAVFRTRGTVSVDEVGTLRDG